MTPPTCARTTCPNQGYPHLNHYCHKHAEHYGTARHRQPADEARTIIHQLINAGDTITNIANRSGASRNTLRNIHEGRTTTVRLITLERLRTVQPRPEFIPAWRAARRIKSLRAAGHRLQELMAHTGLSHGTFNYLTNGTWDTVSVDAFDRIDAYWQAHMLDPARSATNHVKNKDWPLPMDIDDIDDIDDPAWKTGNIRPEHVAMIRDFLQHHTAKEIGVIVGISHDTVTRIDREGLRLRVQDRTLLALDAALPTSVAA